MTNEEAIKTIKHGCIYRDKRGGEALEVAVKALEKQISKKPSETDKARCIHCACVVKRDERFCKNCGQALDWGDNE